MQARGSARETAAPTSRRPGRIASLDWVRGLFLCGSVATVSVLAPRPEPLVHAEWFGVTVQDLVFPLFVTLSGAGLAFAYRNRVGWGPTVRRSLVLLVAGLAYNMVAAGAVDPETLRWTGALQVYAVLVLVIGLLHKVARGPGAWALVTLLVAAGHTLLLHVWQSGCAGGELTPQCNPSLSIDTALLGTAHMYAQGTLGHDPEGVVGILGALLTASVGAVAGHLALSVRGTRRAPAYLLGWAAVAFLAAVATAELLPAMKRLWTTPFALGAGALGVVLLALGMALLDVPAARAWSGLRSRLSWPLVAMGRNSLLVYFGSHLLMILLLRYGGETSYAEQVADAVEVGGMPRASFVVAMVLAWAALAALLHRWRIYLRP